MPKAEKKPGANWVRTCLHVTLFIYHVPSAEPNTHRGNIICMPGYILIYLLATGTSRYSGIVTRTPSSQDAQGKRV